LEAKTLKIGGKTDADKSEKKDDAAARSSDSPSPSPSK